MKGREEDKRLQSKYYASVTRDLALQFSSVLAQIPAECKLSRNLYHESISFTSCWFLTNQLISVSLEKTGKY